MVRTHRGTLENWRKTMESFVRVIGIICGTGVGDHIFKNMEIVTVLKRWQCLTPFGYPSSDIVVGINNGVWVAVLFRHGPHHTLAPHEVNYAANAYIMATLGKRLGRKLGDKLKVIRVVGYTAVGSLREEFAPTHFLVPDQLVDRAINRDRNRFFGGGAVGHAVGANLICGHLACQVIKAADEAGVKMHDGGTLVTIPGPSFGSKADSEEMREHDWDAVGMTTATEALYFWLAEICYTGVGMGTDYDSWKGEHVSVPMVVGYMAQNSVSAGLLTNQLMRQPEILERPCTCARNLDAAIQNDLCHLTWWKTWQTKELLRRYRLDKEERESFA